MGCALPAASADAQPQLPFHRAGRAAAFIAAKPHKELGVAGVAGGAIISKIRESRIQFFE
jgi:hypothetical protein